LAELRKKMMKSKVKKKEKNIGDVHNNDITSGD
jgi:hypothetical protein